MADEPKQADTAAQPQAAPFKPRNLVVLSDGTGNSAAKLFRTNVWRIYEALDLNCDDQVALYDNGVGTGSFKPLAALGGAFGYGLKRNVLELYMFLCRNYKAADGYEYDPGNPAENEKEHAKHDHIFAFGFSRGAFTARVVAALVASEGLVRPQATDVELNRLARWAYRRYRAKRYGHSNVLQSAVVSTARWFRDTLLRVWQFRKPTYEATKRRHVPIDFLGVFDTVAAYGLPIDELTRGWDKWVWPMTPRDSSLHERVKYGRHAVAIDDERQTFFPLLWDEDSATEQQNRAKFKHPADRIRQVWFAGMHSNIGGGYADDALSFGPLCWMAREASDRGLRFQPHRLRGDEKVPIEWRERAAPCAPMGDSRHGLAAYYRYHPRPIARLCGYQDHSTTPNPKSKVHIDLPKIHESVFERIRDSRDNYAPIALPERYSIVRPSGELLTGDADATPPSTTPNPFEHSTQAASRAREQQRAWDAVWMRRVVYFTTIAATLFLLALPMVPVKSLPGLDSSHTLSAALSTVGGFLPGFAQGVLDAYHDRPGWFFMVASGVLGLLWLGSRLKIKVNDRMDRIWASRPGLKAARQDKLAPEPDGWIYGLRESRLYKGWFRFMSDKLWPTVFGLAILIVLLGAIPLRLAYQVVSRMESFGTSDQAVTDVQVAIPSKAATARVSAPAPVSPGTEANAAAVEYVNGKEVLFYPNEINHRTGITLEAGRSYAIQIAIPLDPLLPGQPGSTSDELKIDEEGSCRKGAPADQKKRVGGWKDATLPVISTKGIGGDASMKIFTPFRRIWGAPWFVPIAAIGVKAPERHYLTEPTTEFTATRTGPLSLYVNDAALPLGWNGEEWCSTWDCYYRNNTGGPARVRVIELDANTTAASLPSLEPFTCPEQLGKLTSQQR